jgi:hypothetical protein
MMTAERILCALHIDGMVRSVCCGCTERLEQAGMVRCVDEAPINQKQTEFVQAMFEIVPPHTLDDCREKIRDRHIGRPWGA